MKLAFNVGASLTFSCRTVAFQCSVRKSLASLHGFQILQSQNSRQLSSSSCRTFCIAVHARNGSQHLPGQRNSTNPLRTSFPTRQRWFSDVSESGAYVEASTSAEQTAPDPGPAFTGVPKLVVFGGNGFVGSRVCEEALKTGLAVVSVNRSGPPKQLTSWTKGVEWVRADVFDVLAWRSQLEGAIGVVSTLGAFGSNDFMYKICGEANVKVFEEAAGAGVPRAAFISVHDYGLPDFVLSGYFKGKRRAEEALKATFPTGGVAIRPSFIYGTRYVSGVGVPLGAIGVPLEKVLSFLPTKSLASVPLIGAGFVPPISVEAVARAAVTAATDPAVPAGIMDIWQLQSYENKV